MRQTVQLPRRLEAVVCFLFFDVQPAVQQTVHRLSSGRVCIREARVKKNLDAATECAHGQEAGAKINLHAAKRNAHGNLARKKSGEKEQQRAETALKSGSKNREPAVLSDVQLGVCLAEKSQLRSSRPVSSSRAGNRAREPRDLLCKL